MDNRLRVAVVGGGVAGIVAAHRIQDLCSVTLFEKGQKIGGHTYTVKIDKGPDQGLGVDIGFIVCNDRTYPNFHSFVGELGVNIRSADMSFSFSCEKTGLAYCSRDLNTLFAQRKNLFSPRFLGMLYQTTRFWKVANQELDSGVFACEKLGDWLSHHGLTGPISDDYILPISAAMWSSPDSDILTFPVETFLRFFKNHGLLSYFNQPQWQTVVGGSRSYVHAFLNSFKGEIRTQAEILAIRRDLDGVVISTNGSSEEKFDHVIVATHADQALALLSDPTDLEREILLPWKYHKNRTVLHTDSSVLPADSKVWASWNYSRSINNDRTSPVAITYYMNLLQGFKSQENYCVTLNPTAKIDDSKILADVDFAHPCFTLEAVRAIGKIDQIQGRCRTWYCGSYHGFGFHEDAVSAAVIASDGVIKRIKDDHSAV